jgi:hypothetical protein
MAWRRSAWRCACCSRRSSSATSNYQQLSARPACRCSATPAPSHRAAGAAQSPRGGKARRAAPAAAALRLARFRRSAARCSRPWRCPAASRSTANSSPVRRRRQQSLGRRFYLCRRQLSTAPGWCRMPRRPRCLTRRTACAVKAGSARPAVRMDRAVRGQRRTANAAQRLHARTADRLCGGRRGARQGDRRSRTSAAGSGRTRAAPTKPAADDARAAFFSLRLPVGVLQDALFRHAGRLAAGRPGPHRCQHRRCCRPERKPLLDSNDQAGGAAFLAAGSEARRCCRAESCDRALARRWGDRCNAAADWSAPEPDQSWHSMTPDPPPAGGCLRRPAEAKRRSPRRLGATRCAASGDVAQRQQEPERGGQPLSWFVGAMLAALMLAWLVIEIGIIRRIAVLIKRADDVVRTCRRRRARSAETRCVGPARRGRAGRAGHRPARSAAPRARRRRARNIRAEQERDMWHAVGHEIMSPLQSLMVLHPAEDDQSHRYMQAHAAGDPRAVWAAPRPAKRSRPRNCR